MKVISHNCPNCKGVLKFEPKSQKWNCKHCKSSLTIEELKKHEKAHQYVAPEKSKNNIFCCRNCGAVLVTEKNTSATECIYCNNTALIKERLTGEFAPSKIIPFQIDKEQALKIFVEYQKTQMFMPKIFDKKENIEKITGIYIPYWLYKCDINGVVDLQGTKRREATHQKDTFITIETYHLKREGKMSFENIALDASVALDDEMMASIEPYDYDKMQDYNHSYLAGFLAEAYDDKENKLFEKIKPKLLKTFENIVKYREINYETLEVTSNGGKITNVEKIYCLIPVWFVNVNYNNKKYIFAINGQTGKVVGDPPINLYKVVFIGLVLIYFIYEILRYFG